LDEQMLLTDSNKRAELMIEAVNIIAEDVPCIMIDFYNNIYVSDKNIEGYDIAPLWYWDGFVKQLRAVE
jgi:peptide/nickel transport system substrate-binding protein